MFQYIIRRLLLIIPVLLGVLFLTFVLMYMIPGDPVLTMLGQHADDEIIERIRAELNLDEPWYIQFYNYIKRTLRGDLGRSYISNQEVTEALRQKLPNTFKLAIAAVVIGGTAFSGGKGSLLGTLVGGLILGTLRNGLSILNVPGFYQQIIIGLVIILAVYFDKLKKD